jgi:hypothetical protein
MVGSKVIFTANFLFVSFRVSLIASRKASGDGWVSAVRVPIKIVPETDSPLKLKIRPKPPALETAATS